ncbi:2,4-dienoyl-CoA reductase-like NADH-dependent reductase (Old Yellow Enzyme family) [Kitasatospora sp. MAP12-15]|uniref:NADH:flavin oxidoreductase/NADH oxidase n=1 Tax=unclassified Kitasatospora TaxID=2633591 RepID=UPI0024752151|nr:NADH:flavin oxidoreductase/NADH oxidase [Kitasatospora sp. MAP12-44]MDH6109035.1 2,4-dienoyl-CoA reductase-like NADH-dependent reductase (Old Yellow Enzyme family) [Kitasatospora sp. MAP12-44]
MSALFSSLTLRELTIPNRAWMAPMCMYSAAAEGPETGVATDFHLTHLASRAAGGAGLVMTEATAVLPEGRISAHDLGLWNERQQQALTKVTAAIRGYGAVAAIQLAHAGRKASCNPPLLGGTPVTVADGGWQTVGPSAEPFGGNPAPHELTVEEIAEVVQAFADAARRALAAGFQVVEVHGAHGYLVHSFLSPVSNRRTDAYGGSFENRTRFALEVVRAVRAVWPQELPVLFRTSATDWLTENPEDGRDGWTGADTVRLAKELAAAGVDLLDVSTGGLVPDARIPAAPGFQVPFATEVRQATGLPTGAVGLITDPSQAEQILTSGEADVVLLGRELLRNPYWPHRAAIELGADTNWPTQYGWAIARRG